jgi:hypothetical protein
MEALCQLQGMLEWLYMGHSPAKVLTTYHELVTRLLLRDTLVVENCWGMSPVILLSHFQMISSICYSSFQTLWQSALANFPGQIGNISHIQNFYSLPPFMCLFFQKFFYPPL